MSFFQVQTDFEPGHSSHGGPSPRVTTITVKSAHIQIHKIDKEEDRFSSEIVVPTKNIVKVQATHIVYSSKDPSEKPYGTITLTFLNGADLSIYFGKVEDVDSLLAEVIKVIT